MSRAAACHRAAPRQRGVTLVELMVTLLVGMILTAAVFGVLAVYEGRKRTTTSVNDVSQSGSFAMHMLDRWVRSAGSGFAQAGVPTAPAAGGIANTTLAFGCRVLASRGAAVLPRAAGTPLPAPFANVNTGVAGSFRLAPVLVLPGQTVPGVSAQASDVIVVMAGAGGFGDVPLLPRVAIDPAATAFATPGQIHLANSVSLAGGDLLLVADQPAAGGAAADCMVQEVAAGFAGGLPSAVDLGGSYAVSPIAGTALATFSEQAVAMKLGNVGAGNPPGFLLIGVGDDNTLFSYDLLQTAGADVAGAPSPNLRAVADGVFELHALYGVDGDGDGRVDQWIDPGAAPAGYTLPELMSGSAAAATAIGRIKALRVGLILRTALRERDPVAPAQLVLFSDLGPALTHTRVLAAGERHFRYRSVESTIPLRNALLID